MVKLNDSKIKFSQLKSILNKYPVCIIGLNSGTSGDGLDIVLAKFGSGKPKVLYSRTYYYPGALSKKIISYSEPEFVNGVKWLELDNELGDFMGKSTKRFIAQLKRNGLKADLIASHGQTIRHLPNNKSGSITNQIGNPSLIAVQTGLPVVYDFRAADIAAGGEGAPLSPYLHQHLFAKRNKSIAVVNIGGIANITYLPSKTSRKKPFASDTGPGNMVIDACMKKLYKKPFDKNGTTALKGEVNKKVVGRFLKMAFFKKQPPKSTGRELFGAKFSDEVFKVMYNEKASDVIATVSEITALSISLFINKHASDIASIYLCGGGAKNKYLAKRLIDLLPDITISNTDELGYSPDYLEALLWAYLGYLFINGKPVDGKLFTGAKNKYIPGRLCLS